MGSLDWGPQLGTPAELAVASLSRYFLGSDQMLVSLRIFPVGLPEAIWLLQDQSRLQSLAGLVGRTGGRGEGCGLQEGTFPPEGTGIECKK